MATDAIRRFSFDFAELVPAPAAVRLRVLPPPGLEVPARAEPVVAGPRPRWLPELVPAFAFGDPLHVRVLGASDPSLGARVAVGLAGLLAAAGSDANLQVLRWDDRVVAGGHHPHAVAERPHALLVATAPWPESVADAARLLATFPAGRRWLLMVGGGGDVERHLGLERLPNGVEVVRAPAPGAAVLQAEAAARNPALTVPGWGRALLGVAREVVAAYRALEP